MNLSAPFVRRPIGTTLLTIGIALAGIFAFFKLPVSPLPQVDFPTIVVSASMAGASPEVMSNTVATPLERHLSGISDVTEMTSRSSVGSTQGRGLRHRKGLAAQPYRRSSSKNSPMTCSSPERATSS